MVPWSHINVKQALLYQTRSSSMIHFACIGVALPRAGLYSQEGATPMPAKWIKLDLSPNHGTYLTSMLELSFGV